MAYRISIAELGIANDNTFFEGATPGDVWQQVREHLNDKHNIKIPELEDAGGAGGILPIPPRFDSNSIVGQQGPAVATGRIGGDEDSQAAVIVTRLVEKLRVGEQASGSSDIVPPGGTQSLMP